MCDISNQTNLKQKTIYKVAWLIDGKYYSVFSQHELKTGKVLTFPYLMFSRSQRMFGESHKSLDLGSNLYNNNMLGRVSGFALKSDAIAMCTKDDDDTSYVGLCLLKGHIIVILKMVITGSILRGSTSHVSSSVSYDHDAYAGDYIKSMKKIFSHSNKI